MGLSHTEKWVTWLKISKTLVRQLNNELIAAMQLIGLVLGSVSPGYVYSEQMATDVQVEAQILLQKESLGLPRKLVLSPRLHESEYGAPLLAWSVSTGGSSTLNSTNSIKTGAKKSRQYNATRKVAFDATMAAFQDLGFLIENAEIQSGFVSAKSPSSLQWAIPFMGQQANAVTVTAFIEELEGTTVVVRLNAINSTQGGLVASQGGGVQNNSWWPWAGSPSVYLENSNNEPILDSALYKKLFSVITRVIETRKFPISQDGQKN